MADSLFKQKAYYEASIEYERVIYHSNNFRTTNQARYKKALCYKYLEQYSRGLTELQQLMYVDLPDSLQFKYRYQTALLAYLSGDFMVAESVFKQMELFVKDSPERNDIWLLRTLNYNELLAWDQAFESGIKYLHTAQHDSSEIFIQKWKNLYDADRLPRLKKSKLANVLRMVPGLGQIYAGGWAEGIFNFILNASFLAIGVDQVLKSYYVTGYFTAAIPISKFYFGGQRRTQFLVEKTNYERIRAFNECAKMFLLDVKGQ